MAKLPDATTFGQRPGLAPRTGAIAFNPNTGSETAPGQALAKLGTTLEGVAEEIRKENYRSDTLRAEDAFNKLRERQLDLTSGQSNGFVNKKGGDAANQPIMEDYGKRFEGAAKEIEDGLGNDQQKQLFRRRASIAGLQFKQDLLNHVTREKDIYETGVYKGTLDLEYKNAVERYQDPAGIALSLERMNNAISQEAARKGWAPEVAEATKRDALSKVHGGVIERMLANQDDISAQKYYEANKANIAGPEAANLEKQLEIGSTRTLAQTFADQVQASNLSESEAIKKARTQFSGKQEEAVVLAVRGRFQEQNLAKQAEQAQAADTAWDLLAKTKRLDSIPPAVLNRMDGKVRLALEKEANDLATGKDIKTDPGTYYDLATILVKEPEKFQKLDLRQYFNKLDQGDREHFINLQRPANMADAATLSQQLSNMHDQMGWGSGDKEKKGVFDKAATQAIDDEQRKRGTKLTMKERQEVIDRMVLQGEVMTGKWYLPDANKQVFQIYGTEDAKNFMPEINDTDRKTIVASFKKKGVNKPSDEQIVNAYRRWKGL